MVAVVAAIAEVEGFSALPASRASVKNWDACGLSCLAVLMTVRFAEKDAFRVGAVRVGVGGE